MLTGLDKPLVFAAQLPVDPLGVTTNGADAARIASSLGIPTTAKTIIRRVLQLPLPSEGEVAKVGIDEWAWKKGHRYGIIVVDLERKKPIALLPDRSQQTVTQWLKRYPTINIVARDRSKEFAAAIKEALPEASHVADRWHLAKNLTEHLDKVVSARW